ncbi:MAG: hypothetical protein K1X74_02005 [Pirellulales bacterium]|nr:hypothetical protein [Pirellulales bacterium]
MSGMLRLLVMLLCLVALPALAICGAPVSKLFRPLVNCDWQKEAETFVKRFKKAWSDASVEEPIELEPPAAVDPPSTLKPETIAAAPQPATGELALASHTADALPPPHGGQAQRAQGNSPGAIQPPVSLSAADADPFQALQRQLRDWGATYYKLETWGAGGELYHFHCRMAIDRQGLATRHFESTTADPLAAIQQVVREVEAWIAAGRQ